MSFAQFITAVQNAINREDGAQLRGLLQINNPDAASAVFEARQNNARWAPAQACRRLPEPWDEVVAGHAQCMAEMQAGRHAEAYAAITSAVQPFIKAFQADQTAWTLQPMLGFVRSLRSVAEAADAGLAKTGKRPEKLADCLDKLRKLFQAAQQASGNKAKKLATLDLVNVQFKVFFRLNTVRLCASLERAVASKGFLPLDHFPPAHQVTYGYYVGRLAIFDEDYSKAQERLTAALRQCHRSAAGNRSKLLKYLVPVQMLLGRLPRPGVLEQHGLRQYQPIAEALRSGGIGTLNRALAANQRRFIMEGIYLLLERLKFPVYRRLFKRVQLLHAEENPAKAAQLPLGLFQKALRWQGLDLDMDEVECVTANLIYKKYVKGYISHKNQVVVLSKLAPYPPLKDIDLTQ